ncbi:MAG: cytidine/deoxycytidylate deaminase family protein [Candidatus Omnitrophota bacterium]
MSKSKVNKTRPGWDEYFLEIAAFVSQRSSCLRRKVGAVVVKNKRILATGYNGAPTKLPHCGVTGCLRRKFRIPSGSHHELCRGLHAEMNAILQAASHGINITDSTLYATNQPCILCAKMMINAGIKKIVAAEKYPDDHALNLFKESGVIFSYKKNKEN